jgi:chemotaxis family two-component system sensor kinase Cph1
MTLPETGSFLPAGTPVDLTNCEREPIHIPGSVQPHGALLTFHDASGGVQQASTNAALLLGRAGHDVLGLTLDDLFDADSVRALAGAMAGGRVSTTGAPLRVQALDAPAEVWLDALVHRSGDAWILEVEPQHDEVDVGNTLRDVRSAVAQLTATETLEELFETAVRLVREISRFDRVMFYRFDRDWNGEVVAEAQRGDLESFRGLHYPASDIPPQARALYTVNWLRFIRDVDAVNVPLVPQEDPGTQQPLDLSLAALRSVSPIHCEYLRNMGVSASMSVSLVIDGTLAGLIACHHYSGPYVPSAPVRATCEFLAQTLSLMLGGRERDERLQRTREIQTALDSVRLGALEAGTDLGALLARSAPELMGMVGASGMAWTLDGRTLTHGEVPPDADLQRLRSWGRSRSGTEGLVESDGVALTAPALEDLAPSASGLLMLLLAEQEDVLFLRREAVRTVDWGGNPHLKNLEVGPDGVSRLSPRGSFALWRDTVRLRSVEWTDAELEAAARLRTYLVQVLYERNRALAGVAETLQRSLLPESLPPVPGSARAADYRPASVAVGGDWYDALGLPTGEVLLVVGDVAGHGIEAAGAMAQMRNALRAYAMEESDPVALLTRLDRLVAALTPDSMATVLVALLDPPSGGVRLVSAGHPPPVLAGADGSASLVRVEPGPPLVSEDDATVLLLQRL